MLLHVVAVLSHVVVGVCKVVFGVSVSEGRLANMQALLRVEEEEIQRRVQERRAQTEDEERRFQQVLPSSHPACLPLLGPQILRDKHQYCNILNVAPGSAQAHY